MTNDTIESLRGRLTLAQREAELLRVTLAAEVDLGQRRASEIESLKREVASLRQRIATTTDQ